MFSGDDCKAFVSMTGKQMQVSSLVTFGATTIKEVVTPEQHKITQGGTEYKCLDRGILNYL